MSDFEDKLKVMYELANQTLNMMVKSSENIAILMTDTRLAQLSFSKRGTFPKNTNLKNNTDANTVDETIYVLENLQEAQRSLLEAQKNLYALGVLYEEKIQTDE